MNKPVEFPENYVNPGLLSLEMEFPWIVPKSAHLLNRYVAQHHRVLDLGSGGSTFFYARRCAHVHAVETIRDYHDIVADRVQQQNLGDKIKYLYHPAETLVDYIATLPDNHYDIVSVDTMRGTSRSALFQAMLPKWRGSIIVMDNWAHKGLWPNHAKLSSDQLKQQHQLQDYGVFDFYHPEWKGKGTRLVIRHDLQQQ